MSDHDGRPVVHYGRWTACGLAVFAVTAAVIGCARSETPVEKSAPSDRVEPSLVDRAGFDEVVARLAGQVVLVDCWATWCLPCVEQLPHTVDLDNRNRAAGLAVVTLSFDEPGDAGAVGKVLDRVGANRLTNLQSEFGTSSQSMEVFEIAGGALPHYKLYDRSGKLRRTFALDPLAKQQFTSADVDAAVAELLAE